MTNISDPLFSKAPHSKLSAIEVTLVVQSSALCCTFSRLSIFSLVLRPQTGVALLQLRGLDQAVKGSLLYLDSFDVSDVLFKP